MRALMVQGTGSNVGKSLLVAGLCRVYARKGLRVRPFKPQNMSNNAAVTADGGEIGRAQALQARAAGVAPSVHMNPVLLKPQSEIGAQVVVQGRVVGTAKAREYLRTANACCAIWPRCGRCRHRPSRPATRPAAGSPRRRWCATGPTTTPFRSPSATRTEPRRDCRRHFGLSHAAMAGSSSIA